MKYSLVNVSSQPELWSAGDPVRPELGVSFKTYPGREVFGLKDEEDEYAAFCCVARTWDIPSDVTSLSSLTSVDGSCYIPYTVWSLKKGAGRIIIAALLDYVKTSCGDIRRVVTLSPNTEMARSFHLRNGADEISTYTSTANFEYMV
tara:strand:- start:3577 stop:4017 length:441 start_codon:yes stop_codon:yes gene_type:complete